MSGAAVGGAVQGLGQGAQMAKKRRRAEQPGNVGLTATPQTTMNRRANTLFGKATDITPRMTTGQRIKSLFR